MADTSPKYACDTGFLITKDDNGNYLPFLLKIRAADIIWSSNGSSDASDALLTEEFLEWLKGLGVEDITQINPTPSYRFEFNEWSVRIDQLYHVTMIREILMEDLIEIMELDRYESGLIMADILGLDPTHWESDEDRIFRQTPVKKERRHYLATIDIPITLKRENFHATPVLNIVEDEYKNMQVNIALDNGTAFNSLKLMIIIDKNPVVEGGEPSEDSETYEQDGIVLPYVEYAPNVGVDDEAIVFTKEGIVDLIEDPYGSDEMVLVINEYEEIEPPEPAKTSVLLRIEGELANPAYYVPEDMLPEPWPLQDEESEEDNG